MVVIIEGGARLDRGNIYTHKSNSQYTDSVQPFDLCGTKANVSTPDIQFLFRSQTFIPQVNPQPSMERYHDADSSDEFRLEDITRRSACDRCRAMKIRCERSNNKGISQLAQCRRCAQAEAKCITTLEAQPRRRPQGENAHPRPTKRIRTASFGTFTREMGQESLGYAAQQAKHALLEYRSEGMAPSDVRPRSGFLQDSDLNFDQWHGFHDIINLDGSARQQELDGGGRKPLETQIGSVVTQPSTANYLDNQGFMECTLPSTMMPFSSQSLPTPWSPQGANHAPWAKLSQPRTFTTVSQAQSHEQDSSGTCSSGSHSSNMSGRSSSKGSAQDMMSRILELNMAMSQNIQRATAANQERPAVRGGGAGSILVNTLQHSGIFLEMMRELMSPGKAETRSDDQQARAGSEETVGWSEKAKGGSNGPKVNMDVALQMLSCNMTIGALYQALSSELITVASSSEAVPLPELRLEGLPNGLDSEMHVSLLAHICMLMFLKIQHEFARFHRQGFLSPMAQSTFEAVLAANRDKVAQTAESLRRLILDVPSGQGP